MGRWRRTGFVSAVIGASIVIVNASILAPAPEGRPVLVAQRGVSEVLDRDGAGPTACLARRLRGLNGNLIENTIPSIAAGFAAGADVVEIDVRQARDGEFVLYHDDRLECRTQGNGRVFETDLVTLKALDVGYGYTADGGRTFPLRGKGTGLMPTLAEALRAFPGRRFMIQLKSAYRSEGDALAAYLDRERLADWNRLVFFGAPVAVDRLKAIRPMARTWTDKGLISCTTRYLALGWSGYVPADCRGQMIAVPVNLRYALWGWPNRLIARMDGAGVGMLAMRAKGFGGFSRVDTAEDLARLPDGYGGYVWTDHIEVIGRARTHAGPAGSSIMNPKERR